MNLYFVKKHPNALFEKAHVDDAGFDMAAMEGATIEAGHSCSFHTGISVAVPSGYVGLLVGRSGLGFKNGVRLANSVGVIDAGFTGEVVAKLHNDSKVPVVIKDGQRICQMVIVPIADVVPFEVPTLEQTERGEKGFGSTGS